MLYKSGRIHGKYCLMYLKPRLRRSPKERCSSGWLYSSQYSEIVDETKYLDVILQSNLKLDKHIQPKTRWARQQLGMIKCVWYDAPEKAKLLAYTTLCRPHVIYAPAIWDPFTKQLQHELDMVQNGAIWFICKLKRRDSGTEALEKLDVQTLGDRCKTSRHNLLLRLLVSEENHGPLIRWTDNN